MSCPATAVTVIPCLLMQTVLNSLHCWHVYIACNQLRILCDWVVSVVLLVQSCTYCIMIDTHVLCGTGRWIVPRRVCWSLTTFNGRWNTSVLWELAFLVSHTSGFTTAALLYAAIGSCFYLSFAYQSVSVSWLTPTDHTTHCVTPSHHRAVHKAGC